MDMYVGIDPSINSTGITIRCGNDVKFYILKGGKLTKKEKEAQEKNKDVFEYVLYDKEELSKDHYVRELNKSSNISSIADSIYYLLLANYRLYIERGKKVGKVLVCMEGISYGSIKSAAVMDLAGLNYMIRDRVLQDGSFIDYLYVVPPAEIKRFATGQGNANKVLMIAAFQGTWPDLDLPKVDDVCDSWFMSKFAQYREEKSNS